MTDKIIKFAVANSKEFQLQIYWNFVAKILDFLLQKNRCIRNIKKSNQYSGRLTEIFYKLVKETVEKAKEKKHRLSISGILKILGVSTSGYYEWKERKPSKTKVKREELKKQIKKIYEESKQNYGAPKITEVIKSKGEKISARTVGLLMKQMKIKAQWIGKYKTSLKSFEEEYHNILQQQFNPLEPNEVWVTDITYIWTTEGFVYLSSIMDLFSRKIIAWKVSDKLEISFVLKTIELAKYRRSINKPLIIHSDRGSHYTSESYKVATDKLIRSYSKKGYPYDNACIEAFHSVIKRECLNRFVILNLNHAKSIIFEYIETFYNTVRIHSHCGYISPNDFEKQYQMQKKQKLQFAV